MSINLNKLLPCIGVPALIVLLGGCSIDSAGTNVDDKPGLAFEYFHIKGMPCVLIHRTTGSKVWDYIGASCDWDKHKG